MDFLDPSEIRRAHVTAERITQAQRCVELNWLEGSVRRRVQAREGIPTRELAMELGVAVEQLLCEFTVIRCDLPAAPPIDTVFEVTGRPGARWRFRRVLSGDSPHDPVWTFVCLEEHS
jgi:hypothetical protein